jgi:hypothetical protein
MPESLIETRVRIKKREDEWALVAAPAPVMKYNRMR